MNLLMDVFSMDMNYFRTAVPVADGILDVMYGIGWALLLGNLVFQAAKSMMTGLGFEGEEPQMLAGRTLVFAFLLVVSRQICEIGLGLSATVVDMLSVPDSVILPSIMGSIFSIDADWVIIIIIGIVLIVHLVKFFFEVGERYVIVGVLTILSPLAFAMGGSRNTMDIFKGWARMYGSMCLMMAMNVVFLKLIVSAMAIYPRGLTIFPWLILVIALARVSRKIDSIIARIGLNPAITGDGLGRGLPGMMALMVGKSIASQFIGSKMSMGKAAASSAKGAAAGMSGKAAGFSGGARPAPSPINTSPTSVNSTAGTASASGGTGQAGRTTFNPPLGRTNTGGQASAQQSRFSQASAQQSHSTPTPVQQSRSAQTSAQQSHSSQTSANGGTSSSRTNARSQSIQQGAQVQTSPVSVQNTSQTGAATRINASSQSVQQGARVQNNPVSLQSVSQTGASVQSTQQGAQVRQNTRTTPQSPVHAASGTGAKPTQTAKNATGTTSAKPQASSGKHTKSPSPSPVSRASTNPTEKSPNAATARTGDTQTATQRDTFKKPANPGLRQTPEPMDIGTNADTGNAVPDTPPENAVPETKVTGNE